MPACGASVDAGPLVRAVEREGRHRRIESVATRLTRCFPIDRDHPVAALHDAGRRGQRR